MRCWWNCWARVAPTVWHLMSPQMLWKYLGYLHNQARSEYVVRRFRGTRNKIPLVTWNREDCWTVTIYSVCLKIKTWELFETLPPSHVSLMNIVLLYFVLLVLNCCLNIMMVWHFWWLPLLWIQKFRCYSLHVMLQFVIVSICHSAQFSFGPTRGPRGPSGKYFQFQFPIIIVI